MRRNHKQQKNPGASPATAPSQVSQLDPPPAVDDHTDKKDSATQPVAHVDPTAPDDELPPTQDGRKAVLYTTIACVLVAVIGHLALLAGWLFRGNQDTNLLPWQPVVGATVAGIAVIAFGGMYYAALRVRVAIMASFILTFLLLMTYVLTVKEIGQDASQSQLAKDIMGDFRAIVQTVIGFYFTTEVLLSGTKIIKSPGGLAANRADRDLPSVPAAKASSTNP